MEKRNTIKKWKWVLFIVLGLVALDGSAQGCEKVIKTSSGTVFGGSPAKASFRPSEKDVLFEIQKIGGRAKVTVQFYVNDQLWEDQTITFPSGSQASSKTKRLEGVKGKNIRVQIVNHAVGNKFDYKWVATQKCFNSSR